MNMKSSNCEAPKLAENETLTEIINRTLNNARDNMWHLRSSRQRAELHLDGNHPTEACAGSAVSQREVDSSDGIVAMLAEISSLQRDTARELELLDTNIVNALGS